MKDEVIKYQFLLDKRGNLIRQDDGSYSTQNSNDFYINIPLHRDYEKFNDYVNIDKDKKTTTIQRQEVNPAFVELAFFETVNGIGNDTIGNQFVRLNSNIIHENILLKAKLYNITINK